MAINMVLFSLPSFLEKKVEVAHSSSQEALNLQETFVRTNLVNFDIH